MSTPEQPCNCEQALDLALQLHECCSNMGDAGKRIEELNAELETLKRCMRTAVMAYSIDKTFSPQLWEKMQRLSDENQTTARATAQKS